MPTAPISFSMNHFFLFHSGKKIIFFYKPLFPFSLGQKRTVNVPGKGNDFFFFKSARSKLSTRMKIKMETFQGALHF